MAQRAGRGGSQPTSPRVKSVNSAESAVKTSRPCEDQVVVAQRIRPKTTAVREDQAKLPREMANDKAHAIVDRRRPDWSMCPWFHASNVRAARNATTIKPVTAIISSCSRWCKSTRHGHVDSAEQPPKGHQETAPFAPELGQRGGMAALAEHRDKGVPAQPVAI